MTDEPGRQLDAAGPGEDAEAAADVAAADMAAADVAAFEPAADMAPRDMTAFDLAADPVAADLSAFAVADGPALSAEASSEATPVLDPGDASLLALVDRLGTLLDRSDLSELAVEAGGTRLVLRKPSALAATAMAPLPGVAPVGGAMGTAAGATGAAAVPGSTSGPVGETASRPSVKAPLTGVWYGSPAPGSAAFTEAGREVAVGQVIGLIEAMKLFNEIKSDLAGRVVRVVPESGALVKAKQPLIEVDPL